MGVTEVEKLVEEAHVEQVPRHLQHRHTPNLYKRGHASQRGARDPYQRLTPNPTPEPKPLHQTTGEATNEARRAPPNLNLKTPAPKPGP